MQQNQNQNLDPNMNKIKLLSEFYGIKSKNEIEEEKKAKKEQSKNEIKEIMEGGNFKTKEDAKLIYKNVYDKLVPKLEVTKNARNNVLLKNKKIKWEKNVSRRNVKVIPNSLFLKYSFNNDINRDLLSLISIDKMQLILDIDSNKKLYGYEMHEYISTTQDTYITSLPDSFLNDKELKSSLSFIATNPVSIEYGDKILTKYSFGDSPNIGEMYSTKSDLVNKVITFQKIDSDLRKNVGLVNDTLLKDKLIIREPNIHSTIIYVFNTSTDIKVKTDLSITLSDYFSYDILQKDKDLTNSVFSPYNLYLYDIDTLQEILKNFTFISDVGDRLVLLINMYTVSDKSDIKGIKKYFSVYNKFYNLAKSIKKMVLNGSTSNSIKKIISIIKNGVIKDKKINLEELNDTYSKYITKLDDNSLKTFDENLKILLKIRAKDFLGIDNNLSFDSILTVFIKLTNILNDKDVGDAIKEMQTNKFVELSNIKIKKINDNETGKNIIGDFNTTVSRLKDVLMEKRKFEVEEIKKNLMSGTGDINVEALQKILGVKRKFDDVFNNVEQIDIDEGEDFGRNKAIAEAKKKKEEQERLKKPAKIV